MVQISKLWTAPDVNPINNKAKWVPILNPFCMHGRVFFLSWLGFMVAFLSWYAFPPLTPLTLRTDLNLTNNDIANGNVLALTATLIVRVIMGPLCDRYGPRKCMAWCLLLGAIPSALAGTATNATGLIIIRFFVGILGATFVPCQVWCTGFFDTNCVGRANALAAGWGNAGGGITYFVMPAVFDSLIGRGLTPHIAWRVSFVTVPFVIVATVGLITLFFAPDTPFGPWKDRHINRLVDGTATPPNDAKVVDIDSYGMDQGTPQMDKEAQQVRADQTVDTKDGKKFSVYDNLDVSFAEAAVIKPPTVLDIIKVLFTRQTLMQCACYFCTFGGELAINSNLSSFYIKSSGTPPWTQTYAANWAAMYGLLNVVTRPMGGFIGDLLYPVAGIEGKKFWMIACPFIQGIVLTTIGFIPNINVKPLIAAVAVSAIFTDAGNGANFAVIPHIHPSRNGIVSGLTGASGNLGGVVFALVFRFNGTDYHKSYWIIGIISLVLSLSVSWIRVPKLPGEMGWWGKPRPGHL